MYAVIYVIGVFQPKQIKTCAIVCRPFEILCEAAENLACARKLFLYNLLCMTHHIIFETVSEKTAKAAWTLHEAGISEKASQQTEVKENLNTLQLHLKLNPFRNNHRSINYRK